MKSRILSLLIFLIILLPAYRCRKGNNNDLTSRQKQVNNIIQTIRKKWAPDARDHVFEISFSYNKNNSILLHGATDRPEALTALRDSLEALGVPVIDSVLVLPVNSFRNLVGVVRLSVANLRTRPEHSAELASQMLMGMPVHILEKRNGFFRIRTTEGYLGWTDSDALIMMYRPAFEKWARAPKVIMDENYGKIYADTLPDAPQISDVVKNDVLILLGQHTYFLQVQLPDGRRGFVPSNDFVLLNEWEKLNKDFAALSDITTEALHNYPGIPYLWGGTSVKALDCSGFTKNLYQSFGYLLPRDASQQARAVRPVPLTERLDSLQPADLLFFGTHRPDGSPKITHVALYLGAGRIIHATGEVKVESLFPEDSLYNDARRKTLLGAGRVYRIYERRIYPYYTEQAVKIFFPDQR